MTELIVDVAHDGATLKNLVVLPEGTGPHPAVLIYHQWSGRSPHEEGAARALAGLGYIGIACDLYGDAKRGTTQEENTALMMPLKDDRAKLRGRLLSLVNAFAAHDAVDADRMAVMGYCFGGLCAIDTARAGARVKASISFHGLLGAPEGLDEPQIHSSVAIHHGWDDPMAPPEHVEAVAKELSARGADWTLTAYGHAVHSFTNRDANAKADGMAYDARADARSWRALTAFLSEHIGS
ncbi:dienelactone hydrolase family protein [Pacificimonas sp. WHA3]|uniref:Dienelactone hydrolase family protein n=1 Tax=Pacificimonas pallii TaxID=2827236 RepID=A0ABS6SHL9_9SPHN|nr:dienelactone hydrolase family protein [Pacificimonas pallii]MBV7257909.1 dienelactone hydrolase family protein [Pacificimonas pallii]